MKDQKYVVIDIETSHFSPEKGGMIIEVAGVKVENGQITEKISQLINPERSITKQITDITGITNAMLEGKPTFREVIPSFYDFIGDATVIAHNANFDWERYLKFFLRKVGIEPLNPVIDTMSLSKTYLKNAEKKYKLGYLCELVNIELNEAHRALADAIATAKLFLYLKEKYPEIGDSIVSPVTHKVLPKHQDIRNVSYWEKKLKGRTMRRIYVTLERSAIFFDLPTMSWEVKSSNEPIDFKSIEKKLFGWYGVEDYETLVGVLQRKRA